MFSLVPRCHGRCGSAKQKVAPRLNSANSFPLPGVTVSTAGWRDGAAISTSATAFLVRDSALPPSSSPLARSTSVTGRGPAPLSTTVGRTG